MLTAGSTNCNSKVPACSSFGLIHIHALFQRRISPVRQRCRRLKGLGAGFAFKSKLDAHRPLTKGAIVSGCSHSIDFSMCWRRSFAKPHNAAISAGVVGLVWPCSRLLRLWRRTWALPRRDSWAHCYRLALNITYAHLRHMPTSTILLQYLRHNKCDCDAGESTSL